MLDAIAGFGSPWRGFAAQKVRERMQHRRAARLCCILSLLEASAAGMSTRAR